MNAAVVAELILKYGLPLATQLVQWHADKKETVTPDDMVALHKLAEYSSADSLAARGVKIVDGKVAPL